LGRRTAKINLSSKRIKRFLWDGNVPLHEWEYDLSERPNLSRDKDNLLVYDKEEPVTENLITWVFDENSFVPAAKLVGDKSYSILTDHLGTPYEAYDENGEKVWARELDLYGNAIAGDSSFIPFLYQGQYYDEEIGLAYNRFRYYSPENGTYISQDPIGLAGNNPNFYGYTFDCNTEVDVWGLVIVYRGIHPKQKEAVKNGTNIQPKDINANYSIQEHVDDGNLNTQYISTSKDIKRAEFYNHSLIIAIDTDKIDPEKVIDISNGIDPQTGKRLKGKANTSVKVKVYYNDLSDIQASQGSEIVSDDVLKVNLLKITANEGSKIQMKVDVKQLNVRGNSGGEVKLSGNADIQEIVMNSGAKYKGDDNEGENVSVTVNAGGKAEVYASKAVNAIVRAGGRIEIHGNPKQRDVKKVVGGVIEFK